MISTDEGEGKRKRKGEEQQEKSPKRKSIGSEDVPVPPEGADATANALQNLTLVKKLEEQQNVGPGTALMTGPEGTTDQSSSNPIASDGSPEGTDNDYDSTGRVIGSLFILQVTSQQARS